MLLDGLFAAALAISALIVQAADDGAKTSSEIRCSPSDDQNGKIASAWVPNWYKGGIQLDTLPWSKYTHLFYSFVLTDPVSPRLSDKGLEDLPDFVEGCHENGVKALASIGGWGGSRGFSFSVANDANRTAFVNAVTSLVKEHHLDGIDFDWEFPTSQGQGCNSYSTDDTANFLSFLQALRKDETGKSIIMSVSVGTTLFSGADGQPINDVQGFADLVDFISIMNYDTFGPWSDFAGPNAALEDDCAPEKVHGFRSAVTSVKAWEDAGMPADKIVLAVPAYGRAYRVNREDMFLGGSTTQLAMYPPFNKDDIPTVDKWENLKDITDQELNDQCPPDKPNGIVRHFRMVELGYIDNEGKPTDDHPYLFDSCTQTAFSYDQESQVLIAYDNAKSMFAKGDFIKKAELKGFAMWEPSEDHKERLVDAIREGAGLKNRAPCSTQEASNGTQKATNPTQTTSNGDGGRGTSGDADLKHPEQTSTTSGQQRALVIGPLVALSLLIGTLHTA